MSRHAAERLQERYGFELTPELQALILTTIAHARRHPCRRAVLIEDQRNSRQRWLVGIPPSTVLHVVIGVWPRPSLITVLAPNHRGIQ